jgi:hypothetical protein
MQRLENKLNFMASIAMIYLVIKRKREKSNFVVEHRLATSQVSILPPE